VETTAAPAVLGPGPRRCASACFWCRRGRDVGIGRWPLEHSGDSKHHGGKLAMPYSVVGSGELFPTAPSPPKVTGRVVNVAWRWLGRAIIITTTTTTTTTTTRSKVLLKVLSYPRSKWKRKAGAGTGSRDECRVGVVDASMRCRCVYMCVKPVRFVFTRRRCRCRRWVVLLDPSVLCKAKATPQARPRTVGEKRKRKKGNPFLPRVGYKAAIIPETASLLGERGQQDGAADGRTRLQ
jgi:hypothetical protein